MDVVEHLRNESARQLKLYLNPVVAIDCIAGKSRAERCDRLADALMGLGNENALTKLKAYRDSLGVSMESSMSLVFSLGEKSWIDGVVDAISREHRGWIEVGSHGYDGAANKELHLPHYRRMLDINHCVAALSRQRTETDGVWAERRQAWLGAYHPNVKVVHARQRWVNGQSVEIDLGTVATFGAQEHNVEAELIALRGIRWADGSEFEIVTVFAAPRTAALATVRQTAGPSVPLGLRDFGSYHVEVVA
jgi:hypothetical protein